MDVEPMVEASYNGASYHAPLPVVSCWIVDDSLSLPSFLKSSHKRITIKD